MEIPTHDPKFKPSLPADRQPEEELDLYTIPTYSRWFSWDEIHDTERLSLREFFDGSSISRTPRIYKEYRDFIISKYREDPSRRLTFTDVRKSLVGDVCLLRKVFLFLENWGLINFSAPSGDGSGFATPDAAADEGEAGRFRVRAEVGPPHGVRVVVNPNSLKPVVVPELAEVGGECGGRPSPLASYSDVFGDFGEKKGLVCANCGEGCDSACYECLKESSIICVKCFKSEKYGENKSSDDFKYKDCTEISSTSSTSWTEAENLLLLESVLKHGDDWDLVAQTVPTKTKLECISRLIEMPFGDLMLNTLHGKSTLEGTNDSTSFVEQVQVDTSDPPENIRTEDQNHEYMNESQQERETQSEGPPLKRQCVASLSEANSPLLKQVACISAKFGPYLTSAAAEAAVTALCEENPYAKELFDFDHGKQDMPDEKDSSAVNDRESLRVLDSQDPQKEMLIPSVTEKALTEKDAIPLTLRIRAAIATALGAAGGHAKLLADQEVREMEHIVATIIETQLKKMHCKLKYIEDLEMIMEQEYGRIQEMKESIISERFYVLQKAFNAGLSRWRDYSVKP